MVGSKSLILYDEQVTALADCLPAIRDSICVVVDRIVNKCESGNFRLQTSRRHGSARLFVGTEYISLTQPDMDYLVLVFHILQQHLRDYISALPDVLSYVTSSLTSTSIVETEPNASTIINYPRLYEELLCNLMYHVVYNNKQHFVAKCCFICCTNLSLSCHHSLRDGRCRSSISPEART